MLQAVFQEMLDTISQQERDLSSEVTAVSEACRRLVRGV
jgi:hypothetical protein